MGLAPFGMARFLAHASTKSKVVTRELYGVERDNSVHSHADGTSHRIFMQSNANVDAPNIGPTSQSWFNHFVVVAVLVQSLQLGVCVNADTTSNTPCVIAEIVFLIIFVVEMFVNIYLLKF